MIWDAITFIMTSLMFVVVRYWLILLIFIRVNPLAFKQSYAAVIQANNKCWTIPMDQLGSMLNTRFTDAGAPSGLSRYLLIHAPFTHILVFWHISNMPPIYFVESNLFWYPHVLYSSNICEILQYNCQLVVITYELINVVRAAHR